MEQNLNRAPGGLSKEEELKLKLKKSRQLVVRLVRDNQENEVVIGSSLLTRDKIESKAIIDSSINDFITELTVMLEAKEISEAKYWGQIVELYCELFVAERDQLVDQGLTEEEAYQKNRWSAQTEDVLSEAGMQTLIKTKREEGESPEEVDLEVKQLRQLLKVRALTLIPEIIKN